MCLKCGYYSDPKLCECRGKEAFSCNALAIGCAKVLAKQFHETYERLAPQFGYETREDTREFKSDSPNGRLMIAVCQEILKPNN